MSNLHYNANKSQVEITETWLQGPYVIITLMILNIVNAGIRLVQISEKDVGFIEIVWIIVGASSIAILVSVIKMRSTQNAIPLEDIEDVLEKTTWGNSAYYIQLKNGKKRYLTGIKSFSEIIDVVNKARGDDGLPFQQAL